MAAPAEGPSLAIALISLLTGRLARRTVAITGELSLTGQILPVGGIREKMLAAARAGVTKFLVPLKNMEDVESLSKDSHSLLTVIPVDSLDDAIDHVICSDSDHLTCF